MNGIKARYESAEAPPNRPDISLMVPRLLGAVSWRQKRTRVAASASLLYIYIYLYIYYTAHSSFRPQKWLDHQSERLLHRKFRYIISRDLLLLLLAQLEQRYIDPLISNAAIICVPHLFFFTTRSLSSLVSVQRSKTAPPFFFRGRGEMNFAIALKRIHLDLIRQPLQRIYNRALNVVIISPSSSPFEMLNRLWHSSSNKIS